MWFVTSIYTCVFRDLINYTCHVFHEKASKLEAVDVQVLVFLPKFVTFVELTNNQSDIIETVLENGNVLMQVCLQCCR